MTTNSINKFKINIFKNHDSITKIFHALTVLLVLGMYYWISTTGYWKFEFTKEPTTYHAKLAESFLNHQLNLNLQAPDWFYKLKEPVYEFRQSEPFSDPNPNHHIQDTSYYNGKFYIYFTPVITVFFQIPSKLLTTYYLPDTFVGFILGSLSFITSLLILKEIIPQWTTRFGLGAIYIFGIGLGNLIPHALARLGFYETSVLCGHFLIILSILLTIRWHIASNTSWTDSKAIVLSTIFALSIAARPNNIIIILFLIGIIFSYRYFIKRVKLKTLANNLIIFIVPLLIIGCILAYYNYARFNDIFELGLKYQLTGNLYGLTPGHYQTELATFRNIPLGLWNYLFSFPDLSPEFPFVHLSLGKSVVGQITNSVFSEPHLGILSMPIIIFSVFSLSGLKENTTSRIYKSSWAIIILFFSASAFLIVNSIVFLVTARYEVEFWPLFLLLSIIGFEILIFELSSTTLLRKIVLLLFVTSIFYTVLINVFASFIGYGNISSFNGFGNSFKQGNPNLYAKLADRFDFWPKKEITHKFVSLELKNGNTYSVLRITNNSKEDQILAEVKNDMYRPIFVQRNATVIYGNWEPLTKEPTTFDVHICDRYEIVNTKYTSLRSDLPPP